LYQQPSVPQEFRTSFDYDVQELVNNMRKMNQAIDTLAVQLKQALSDQDRIRGLEATIRDLEGDLRDWKERSQNAEKTLANISGRSDEDMRTIQVCVPLVMSSVL
jgi:predicted  nucleic acid-binding Zn-ribbon protein